MLQLRSQSLVRRLNISLIAIISAFCLLLATTIVTQANTVNISDPAHVLNADQVRSEAANLPDPISIYTTNTFTGTSSDFDQRTRSHITNANLIVISIDTVHRHLAIVGGSSVSLSTSQYNDAVQAFKSAYGSNGGDYTAATIAAIRSLRSSLGAAPVAPGNNPGGNVPVPSSGGGFLPGYGVLCCIGLLVLVVAGVIFGVMRRRARFGQPVMGSPYQQPYNQPYNQGYPPNYGPNQGGMNPWAAGGLGAAAGGFLGYELGKERGEEEARQQDDQGGNWGGGNDFGGGASGDFGGGSGGDFGGGGGGGDFGGGGGGDFGGGGGGGDFGGGSSGNF